MYSHTKICRAGVLSVVYTCSTKSQEESYIEYIIFLYTAQKRWSWRLAEKKIPYMWKNFQDCRTMSHNTETIIAEVNNTDYLITMAPVSGWDILGSKWTVTFWSWWVWGSKKNWQALSIWSTLNLNVKKYASTYPSWSTITNIAPAETVILKDKNKLAAFIIFYTPHTVISHVWSPASQPSRKAAAKNPN